MPVIFSSDLAFRFAHPAAFSKGEEYFEDGAVKKVWRDGQMYKSVVEGTRRYDVSILVKSEDDIEARCTCPYEGDGICKHAVATILALADNPELATVNIRNKMEKFEQRAEKLLDKANETQVRKFLKQLLLNNEQAAHDFDIFLQGPKETLATVQSYKAKIMKKLDELDLEELEQAWLNSGDDFYDYYPSYRDDNGYDETTLVNIINPFRLEAKKYADNKNFAESGKIFQAIVEALRDKDKEIADKHKDLDDWFFSEINETLNLYYKVLADTNEAKIKQAGLEYLCRLFEHKQFEWNQKELAAGFKEAITRKSEAGICLRQFRVTIAKSDLSPAESSLLARLYFFSGDEGQFEKISLANLQKNQGLTLELLKYYKRQNRKSDILKIANRALGYIQKEFDPPDWDFPQDVEIEIREFLKTVFDLKAEYPQIIGNLEALFFRSKKLNDYKELAAAYGNLAEKEKFLARMKDEFTKQLEIEIMFKVFKLENKKREILDLTRKYKDEHCFPDMIAVISDMYPRESFDNYKDKIKRLLKDSNIKYYPQVAYHLKRMKRIGLAADLKKFADWIVASYKRRPKLMEELRKNGLT